jgi:hypothetical protein
MRDWDLFDRILEILNEARETDLQWSGKFLGTCHQRGEGDGLAESWDCAATAVGGNGESIG